MLIPFVLAALLFYALDPAVDWLQKMRVPRAIGAALMLSIVVAGCGALAYSLQGQALTVIDQLPAGARKLAASLRRDAGRGARRHREGAAGRRRAPGSEAECGTSAGRDARPGRGKRISGEHVRLVESIGLLSAANQLVMVLFLTYFMLLSDQLFKRKLVEIVGTLSQKKLTVMVLEDIAAQIERFLVIQILTSVAVAVVTGGRAVGAGPAAGGALGTAGRHLQLDSVLRTAAGHGRPVDRRLPAVRHDRHDRRRRRRVAAHHDARRIAADADADGSGLVDESGRGLRRACCSGAGCGESGGCCWRCR